MNILNLSAIFLITLFILPIAASGKENDILILKNDLAFEGKVKRIDRSALRFKTHSGSYWIPSSDIFYVKLAKPECGILKNFFKRAESESMKQKMEGLESADDTNVLIYKGYGVIGNDSYLNGVSLLTPQDDDPQHRQITESFLGLTDRAYDDPEKLRIYDQKAKLAFAKNTGIAVGSVLLMGIIENLLFVPR